MIWSNQSPTDAVPSQKSQSECNELSHEDDDDEDDEDEEEIDASVRQSSSSGMIASSSDPLSLSNFFFF